MPKNLQIRNVPDDVHAELRRRAAAERLSLSEYLLREVTHLAERPTIREVLQRAQRRPGGASRKAMREVIREMREGRG